MSRFCLEMDLFPRFQQPLTPESLLVRETLKAFELQQPCPDLTHRPPGEIEQQDSEFLLSSGRWVSHDFRLQASGTSPFQYLPTRQRFASLSTPEDRRYCERYSGGYLGALMLQVVVYTGGT